MLILQTNEKKNTVWLYGAPSTGKTQFVNRLKGIFDCAEFLETKGKFDVKYKVGKTAPCFVLIDEGA